MVLGVSCPGCGTRSCVIPCRRCQENARRDAYDFTKKMNQALRANLQAVQEQLEKEREEREKWEKDVSEQMLALQVENSRLREHIVSRCGRASCAICQGVLNDADSTNA